MEKRTRFIKIAIGRFKNTMTFKITIKEVHEAVVKIDAENYYEALAKVESDYWENPNDYLLEPKDTTFE
nr:MAG TPA: PcfM DpnD/PcfM-like protein [Caudoviricetes sp.]